MIFGLLHRVKSLWSDDEWKNSQFSLERDKILGISLGIVEDDKHGWLCHIVGYRIVNNGWHGWVYRWRDSHSMPSQGVLPCQYIYQIDVLVSRWIRSGILVLCGVVCIHGEVDAATKSYSWKIRTILVQDNC